MYIGLYIFGYLMKVACIYLCVSTEEQDFTRQTDIVHSAREEGYYIAGIYREKASGARAVLPELLRMIADRSLLHLILDLKTRAIFRSTMPLVVKAGGRHIRMA